jgi:hypothetical protein
VSEWWVRAAFTRLLHLRDAVDARRRRIRPISPGAAAPPHLLQDALVLHDHLLGDHGEAGLGVAEGLVVVCVWGVAARWWA